MYYINTVLPKTNTVYMQHNYDWYIELAHSLLISNQVSRLSPPCFGIEVHYLGQFK